MEKLTLTPTQNSPGVYLDPAGNRFEFSGESRPENVRSFYMPILEWLEQFAGEVSVKRGDTPLEFMFNLEYFNSTSAKYILDIFKVLNSIKKAGSPVRVKWQYEEDDEDMYEVGLEMSRMSGVTFDFVKIEL
ncbi:MAG: DUF1987 domain-containing protein [Bacteroidetes bacterium]|nr:DUF1987 domain-containing protein [Bacteroidota bacterium]